MGTLFYIYCPANLAIWDQQMIMFHTGNIKDNLNFKTICGLEEKEKSVKISYENDRNIYVYQQWGELQMEEWWMIRDALQNMGVRSQICFNWEIYKLLFILHNVSPVWIEVSHELGTYTRFKVFLILYQ